MVILMESILCFAAPVAVLYAFHARRKAPERGLVWIGLVLSLLVFIPFVMAMIGTVLNLGLKLCR
jgi:hypothetical protein